MSENQLTTNPVADKIYKRGFNKGVSSTLSCIKAISKLFRDKGSPEPSIDQIIQMIESRVKN